ncbi:MAG: serine/threonine-protein kinase [Myxococcaceae bacterium]
MEQTLGRYQVLQRLAVGGMGELFLAREGGDTSGRLLILKALLPQYASDPALLSQFYDEARLCQLLDHPNVVKVFEVAQLGGMHLIAMEYIKGRDLYALQQDARKLGIAVPVKVAALIAKEVARGLDYAHHATGPTGEPLEVIHRDVTPGNVMVDDAGQVKLLDFGIALAAHRTVQTNTGVLKGTLSYMSPEHLEGGRLTPQSDQFSLGVVLWELLAARRLFEGDVMAVVKKFQAGNWPAPSSVAHDTPRDLERIVMKMLSRAPGDRYRSCGEVADALDHWLRTAPGLSVETFVKRLGHSPEELHVVPETSGLEATHVRQTFPEVPPLDARRVPTAGEIARALATPVRRAGAWLPVGLLAGLATLLDAPGQLAAAALLWVASAGALRASRDDEEFGIPPLTELPKRWLAPALSLVVASAPVLALAGLLVWRLPGWWRPAAAVLGAFTWLYLPAAWASVAEHGTPWRSFTAAVAGLRTPRWYLTLTGTTLVAKLLGAGAVLGLGAVAKLELPFVPQLLAGLAFSGVALATAALWGTFGRVAAPLPRNEEGQVEVSDVIRAALARQDLDAALAAWNASPERPPPGMDAALLLDVGRAAAVKLHHETAEEALSLAMEAEDLELGARAKVLLARLYRERLDRPAEAEVLLSDVVENFPETSAAKVASELLGRN